MGNAFVAVADDEQAIFYNPAGLAGNTKYQFHYVAMDLGISSDVITSAASSSQAFSNLSGNTVNTLMGKNIFAQATIAPSLITPNFGVSLLVDGQFALLSKNQALPQMTVGYETTNGIQAAYGIAVGGKKARNSRGELRIGGAAKMLWRRGGYHTLSLLEVLNLGPNTPRELAGNYGRGIGVDLGSQYIYKLNPRLTLAAGLVYTDIGDTTFGEHADAVKGNLSSGLAATYEFRGTKLILAADQRHMTDQTDWRKKMHIGATVQLPMMLQIYGGINQTSLSYGAAFDFWLVRVTAYTYAEELGSFAFQDSSRRYVLKTALKFDL
jgi:long-subunit fatty acid transport protein